MTYRLMNYPTNALWMPPLSESLIASNLGFLGSRGKSGASAPPGDAADLRV